MKKRSLLGMFLLTFVTLGIYQLFWLYNTKQELKSKGQSVPPIALLFTPFLLLTIVVLFQLISRFSMASGTETASGNTMVNLLSLLFGLVAPLAILPIFLYWFYKYCKAAEVVTSGRLSFGFSYAMSIVLSLFGVGFIWTLIMQEGFNSAAISSANTMPVDEPSQNTPQEQSQTYAAQPPSTDQTPPIPPTPSL